MGLIIGVLIGDALGGSEPSRLRPVA